MKRKHHKISGFQIAINILFILLVIVCVVPLLLVVGISFTSEVSDERRIQFNSEGIQFGSL